MSEPETVHTGKYGYFSIPEILRSNINIIINVFAVDHKYISPIITYLFLYFHLKFIFFLDSASQSTESLEQIAAFDVE